VMTSRRFAAMAAGLFGTAAVLICVIAAIAGLNWPNTKNAPASSIREQLAETVSAAAPVAAIAEGSLQESSQAEVPFADIATVSTPDLVHADTAEAESSAGTPDESSSPSQTLAPEAQPVRVAAVSADEVLHGDFYGVVSAAGSSPAPEAQTDATEAAAPNQTHDECMEREVCVDQYLWSVYERAPKEDTIKVVERRKVKAEGKPQTVVKEFTTLVDEDFAWKDPKAAEKAGMSLMEYVIGGMDREFKLKLYHALRAMDHAGLSPGITSAFRDDYRQSLASGLKAATDRSYHGGSFRGGYGHGLAADLVSVKGETRAERFMSSERLWKWIDMHGKEFGIGRPYLDKDPAHVAPIDGKEYADHRRGGNPQHARSEIKSHSLLSIRDDHRIAKLAKTARSSNY
jgi:hypothetical protein